MTFASFSEAVDWVRPLWGDVPIPFRLHDRGIADDGAPHMAEVFLRYLDARADDRTVVTYTQDCYHWRLPAGDRLMGCPDCHGQGTFPKTVERFRYPMRAALSKLDGVKPLSPLQPRPVSIVMALSRRGWSLRSTAQDLGHGEDMMEALGLLALRLLHERYTVAPIPQRGWISGRSDSQRAAESAVA